MAQITDKNILFKYFFEARYTTDVMFCNFNRLCENDRKNRHYYSGNNHLYGLRTEVSIFVNGLAIGCKEAYPEFVADITIFRKRLRLCRLWTVKDAEESEDVDE